VSGNSTTESMGFKRYSQYQIASAIICHSEKEAHIYIEAADSSSSVEPTAHAFKLINSGLTADKCFAKIVHHFTELREHQLNSWYRQEYRGT